MRRGVAGQMGSCLTVLGLVTGGDGGLQPLLHAVELLEQSPRRLDRARALIELGRPSGGRTVGPRPETACRPAWSSPTGAGAVPLAERALDELRACPSRPARGLVSARRSGVQNPFDSCALASFVDHLSR